jgi:di/tricarboxylate transporter
VGFDAIFVLVVLLAMGVGFVTQVLPIELTAFLGLLVCTIAGMVPADQAFAGFSSSAVITVLAVFFLSAALVQTGVADALGAYGRRRLGSSEPRLMVAVMLVGAVFSAFMPNVAAVAVLMPAVGSLSRSAQVAPSRLMMPLSIGVILGGTTTVLGSPSNILSSEVLREATGTGFGLFEFAGIGAILMVAGTLFMVTLGRRMLPDRGLSRDVPEAARLLETYHLRERLFTIRIPHGSPLDGTSLAASRFGTALGVQVMGLVRPGESAVLPGPESVLHGGDVLLVQGVAGDLSELLRLQGLETGPFELAGVGEDHHDVDAVIARVRAGDDAVGSTLRELRFRSRYGAVVAGIRRGGALVASDLGLEVLREGDEVLALAAAGTLGAEALAAHFEVEPMPEDMLTELSSGMLALHLPEGSQLVGETLAECRIGELAGVTVVGVVRDERVQLPVAPDLVLRADDRLLVTGRLRRLRALLALGSLSVDAARPRGTVPRGAEELFEVAVSPRSQMAGKTLEQLDFRNRYGMQVLALWRNGEPFYRDLGKRALRVGDALLLQGPTERAKHLGDDLIMLSHVSDSPVRRSKAFVAVGALLLMAVTMVTGWLPIPIAAFSAAVLVVLGGAVRMDEVYRAVEWRLIFLIAAILPVGAAVEATGGATWIGERVVDVVGPGGPFAVLMALALLVSFTSQALDNTAAVVVLGPIALRAAAAVGVSPEAALMTVALSASAAYMTPFSSKSALLVMGAGGYRTADFARVGAPLTLIHLTIVVVLAPLIW